MDFPLVDLHLHQERSARLNQVLADRGVEPPVDWRAWSSGLATLPRGMQRLEALWASRPTPFERETPALLRARFEAVLGEAAEVGAVLVEVRLGNETLRRSDCTDLFRQAERTVRLRHPQFRASLIGVLKLWEDPADVEAAVAACIRHGVDGLDFLYLPYDTEADWTTAYRLAERAAAGGLGITAHAGEFSACNIAAALSLPGITRIGHAVYAGDTPELFESLRTSNVAVECCLTSNVLLGAVHSLLDHPLRTLWDNDVPIVLGTDNPRQFATTIADQYALAASAGLMREDLVQISRTAVERSFVAAPIKAELLSLPSLSLARR